MQKNNEQVKQLYSFLKIKMPICNLRFEIVDYIPLISTNDIKTASKVLSLRTLMGNVSVKVINGLFYLKFDEVAAMHPQLLFDRLLLADIFLSDQDAVDLLPDPPISYDPKSLLYFSDCLRKYQPENLFATNIDLRQFICSSKKVISYFSALKYIEGEVIPKITSDKASLVPENIRDWIYTIFRIAGTHFVLEILEKPIQTGTNQVYSTPPLIGHPHSLLLNFATTLIEKLSARTVSVTEVALFAFKNLRAIFPSFNIEIESLVMNIVLIAFGYTPIILERKIPNTIDTEYQQAMATLETYPQFFEHLISSRTTKLPSHIMPSSPTLDDATRLRFLKFAFQLETFCNSYPSYHAKAEQFYQAKIAEIYAYDFIEREGGHFHQPQVEAIARSHNYGYR